MTRALTISKVKNSGYRFVISGIRTKNGRRSRFICGVQMYALNRNAKVKSELVIRISLDFSRYVVVLFFAFVPLHTIKEERMTNRMGKM